MSAEPAAGVGQMPTIRKSLQVSRPWLTGAEARTMVFVPGSAGQVSFSVMTPALLAMTRFWGARSGELGLDRRGDHLVLTELGEGAVDLGEQLETAEVAILAQPGVALGFLGGGHPGRPLGFLERAPTARHAAEDGAHAHLGRGAGVGGDGESAADLAELASLRHVQATFA